MGTNFIKPKFLTFLTALTLVFLTLASTAEAKVAAFITGDASGDLYEYQYRALLESYALSLIGAPAPVYADYAKGKVKLVLDDVNAYVDYEDVLEAYAKAVLTGKNFDMDAYASGTNAKIVSVAKVTAVSVENGQLRFTEKIVGDPEAEALTEVNSALDVAALRAALEKWANVLGLDLSSYNRLVDSGRTAVAAGVMEGRGEGYADSVALQAAFAQGVEKALADVSHILETINSAESPDELHSLLLEYGDALNLALQSYTKIISTRQGQAALALHEALPVESVMELQGAFNNAVAAVLNSYVIVAFSDYDLTVPDMVDKQMPMEPQWYVRGQGWRDAPREEVEYYVNPANFLPAELAGSVTEVIVTAEVLNVRDIPSTQGSRVTSVTEGQILAVEEVQEVLTGTAPGTEGYWFRITVGDAQGWIFGNYADWVAETYNPEMFQFLTLSGSSGITVAELGNILWNKGILSGMEAVFHLASRDNDINEIFLTSMALHESGNGTSQLANGILFTPEDPSLQPRIVYNMYGIGAVDANPQYKGAEYAYNHGWFSPEEAISGGAYFVARNYINNASYRQSTLYKIRWNPGNPGKHQYATDIGWAFKQTGSIRKLYELVNIYSLRFDLPWYKR